MSNSKQILVIGGGGREHAICWKLAQSPKVRAVYVLPGSDCIGQETKIQNVTGLNVKDHKAIAAWCQSHNVDVVVVGPEDPLADGIADVLTAHNIRCFGPSKHGALIESDKSWSKDFMKKFNIPTARYESFEDVNKAKEFIRRYLHRHFFLLNFTTEIFCFAFEKIINFFSSVTVMCLSIDCC